MEYKEIYITYDEYISKFLDMEKPYEGFIIGYGYAYFKYGISMPPHLYGYNSPTPSNIPTEESHHVAFLQQMEECTLETVKLSCQGLFKDNVAEYVVKAGDTLGQIAFLFDITVDDLADWNMINTKNNIAVGQVLTIIKKKKTALGYFKTALQYSDITASTLDFYWKTISKEIQQKKAYQLQKLLKNYLEKAMKTKVIKSIVTSGLGKWSSRLGIVGAGVSAYELYSSENLQERVDAGFSLGIGLIGMTTYGAPIALYWSCGGEWLHKNWREKVLTKQVELGIEGCASVMPFK